jgi:hypothetical protein
MSISSQEIMYNREFQINSYTEGAQSSPRVCALHNGNFIVCWISWGQDGSDGSIFGQMHDGFGKRIGTEFRVNSYKENYQIYPEVCSLENGNFIICWNSNGQDGSAGGIFAQLYNDTGNRIGEEFQVNTYTKNDQVNPKICALNNGNFIICWESYEQDGSSGGIFAQLYDNTGSRIGAEFQVNSTFENKQFYPEVCALDNGRFVICWQSYKPGGTDAAIFARIYDATGKSIGGVFQVNGYSKNNFVPPAIYALKNNTFLISWRSWWQDDLNAGIFAQRFDANGTRKGENIKVVGYTGNDPNAPVICAFDNNSFIICWESKGDDGSGYGIYAQLFDVDANHVTGIFQVNSYTKNNQYNSKVCALDNGKFFICWGSYDQDGSDFGIYAQLYNGTGRSVGEEFQINNYTDGAQYPPDVCALRNGNFVFCWESLGQDGSDTGIFGKYFLRDPVEHNLQSFEVKTPKNDSVIESITPDFRWQKASTIHKNFPWELTYDLYIDSNQNFFDPIIFRSILDTTYALSKGNLLPGKTYYWKVLAKNFEGDSLWSSNVSGFYIDENVTSISEFEKAVPIGFTLEQNYPNPFNPTTTIPLVLAERSRVTVRVYNMLGQVVATLAQDQNYAAGRQQLRFDGSTFAAGIYFVRVEIITTAGERHQFSEKMLMIQ